MLVDIEAFFLNSVTYAQTMQLLDTIEQSETTDSSPKVDDQYAKALGSEESPAVTVEGAVAGGEQTRHECAEDTADTVHAGSADGVVDMQTMVDEFNGKDEHRAADETDDDGSHGRYEVATGGDTHQAGQHAVERQ